MHQHLPERRRRAVIVSLFELQQREVLGEGRRVQLRARLTRIGNRRVEEGACIVERALVLRDESQTIETDRDTLCVSA